jgi:hypothetical protein
LQENNTYKFIFQNFLTFHKKYANIGSIKVIQKGLNEYLLKNSLNGFHKSLIKIYRSEAEMQL